MKVLHIAPHGSLCGIATYTDNLIAGLSAHCENLRFSWPTKEELSREGETSLHKVCGKICKLSSAFDVVHLQNEWGLYGAPGADIYESLKNFTFLVEHLRKFTTKIAITFHTEPFFLDPTGILNTAEIKAARLWKKKTRLLMAGAKCIVHSTSCYNEFLRAGISPKRLFKITHGVLENRDIPTRPERSLDEPTQDVLISLFGHIAPYKGIDLMLDVLKLLPPNYKLCIMGGRHPQSTGNEIEGVLVKIHEEGLNSRVLLTGPLTTSEADLYHRKSDICVAPYQSEKLSASGAITWSLTSGSPVIASNIPAFREIQEMEECLFLCDRRSPYEWAWAIRRCSSDPRLSRKLTEGTKEYCRRFSWSNTGSSHLKLYNL